VTVASAGPTIGAAGNGPALGPTDPPGTGGSAPASAGVDLAALDGYVGAAVRVSGLVSDRTRDGLLLEDGTARAWVVLVGAAIEAGSEVRLGDAVEAVGIVSSGIGGPHVVVADPVALTLIGAGAELRARPRAIASARPRVTASVSEAPARAAPRGDQMPLLGLLIGAFAALGAGAGGLTFRWRADRRRQDERLVARLEQVVGPAATGTPHGPRTLDAS
jgi:hypothetical protein